MTKRKIEFNEIVEYYGTWDDEKESLEEAMNRIMEADSIHDNYVDDKSIKIIEKANRE